jgi:hypothetical protein
MFDSLFQDIPVGPPQVGPILSNSDLAILLGRALVMGGIVAGIYAATQRRGWAERISFATTIVLLTVLIAMVTLVIGGNVARAFSLAGALAIIRFRTVVDDTRDTAFVIFAVVVGMAIGAGMTHMALIGTPIVAFAAVVLSLCDRTTPPLKLVNEYSLAIRVGLGRDPAGILKEIFAKHLSSVSMKSTTTARQGSALDITYQVRLVQGTEAVAFVAALNQIEGVQNVELRQV